MQPLKARFISFEGTEGVGKTTAIGYVSQQLQNQGIDFITTREPGGSEFAEKLRQLLLDPTTDINSDTELLLMFAARCDHINKTILPALHRGTWVLCDRFIDSTMAYQGYGRCDTHSDNLPKLMRQTVQTYGLNNSQTTSMQHKIKQLVALFVPILPDITFWLDLPIEEGMHRAKKRSVADRFEQQTLDFFNRVYTGFANVQQKNPQRVLRIDASQNPKQVGQDIWQHLKQRYL